MLGWALSHPLRVFNDFFLFKKGPEAAQAATWRICGNLFRYQILHGVSLKFLCSLAPYMRFHDFTSPTIEQRSVPLVTARIGNIWQISIAAGNPNSGVSLPATLVGPACSFSFPHRPPSRSLPFSISLFPSLSISPLLLLNGSGYHTHELGIRDACR